MEPLSRIHIIVINLDRDERRLRHMESSLAKADLVHERFPAIMGSKLSDEQLRYVDSPERNHLSPAEAGCTLSHLAVWKKLAGQDKPIGLILEDDIQFQPDFGDLIRFLDLNIDLADGEIHRFETFFARVTLERDERLRHLHRSAHIMRSNHAGAAAYLLSRKTAQHLVDAADKLCHLPDTEMFDPQRRAIRDLKVVQWTPAPCVQDMNLGNNAIGFQSNLEDSRSDDRQGVRREDAGMLKMVKSALRPAYTRLYSLALLPHGRMRQEIDFG